MVQKTFFRPIASVYLVYRARIKIVTRRYLQTGLGKVMYRLPWSGLKVTSGGHGTKFALPMQTQKDCGIVYP